MNSRIILLAGLVLSVSACTQPTFRASVATFGEAAQVTAASQSKRLETVATVQTAQIRSDLVKERVVVQASEGCTALVVPGADPTTCTVVAGDGSPLPQPETFANIPALNAAFASYGKQLVALASDADDDATAFNAALIDLAASANALTVVLDDGPAPTTGAQDVTRAATISGLVLNAAAGASRTAQLRDIIPQTDRFVQEAAVRLDQASEILLQFEVTQALAQAEAARIDLDKSVRQGAPAAMIAAKQAKVFALVEGVRQASVLPGSYAQLAQAHGDLARAARSGLSDADFETSIIELVVLTKSLRETL